MSDICVFNHRAMGTEFQVRIPGAEKTYAAQTAQAAFALADEMESYLSRFRANSDICQIAQLRPGEALRLSEPTFACLRIAKQMEHATLGAFSVTAATMQSQPSIPRWTLLDGKFSIRFEQSDTAGRPSPCTSSPLFARLEFDLGAIGKGFALDRMAGLLREWDFPAFLLVAGGSSIVAGEAPPSASGWSCGLGDDHSLRRILLKNCSLSGSGLAVKGRHILDPRTGQPAQRQRRTWALTDTGAESDSLSTACMVLDETEIASILNANGQWLVFLDDGDTVRSLGTRQQPIRV